MYQSDFSLPKQYPWTSTFTHVYLFQLCYVGFRSKEFGSLFSNFFSKKKDKEGLFSIWWNSLKHWRLLLNLRAIYPGNNSVSSCLRAGLRQWEVGKSQWPPQGLLVVLLSFSGLSLQFFFGAQNVTHCILYILTPFLYVPHFLQRRVRFSRKEILGIVQQVGEEFGVGFGESISYSFKSLFQRKQYDGRKSHKLRVRAPGFLTELRCALSGSYSTQQVSEFVVWTTNVQSSPAVAKESHWWSVYESPFSYTSVTILELPIGTNFHKMGIREWLLMDTMYLYGIMKTF